MISYMVSVLMSIYNERIEWIKQSVESILNQTYKDFEFIIVIDNPEMDLECRKYLEKRTYEDARIKLIWNEKNIGLAQSLNKGIKIAKGEYLARMDADDISLSDRLEMELEYLNKTKCDLVSTNKINIDENDNIISYDLSIKKDPNKILQYSNIIVHPSVLVKMNVIKDVGGYRSLRNSEDLDLWLRMIDKGYYIKILDKYLLKYRIRNTSASVERGLEQYFIDRYIVTLMKERQKKGTDSFSTEKQNLYIQKKNITDRKKKIFQKAHKEIEESWLYRQRGKKLWFLPFIRAFFRYPNYVLNKIYRFYCSSIKA